MKRLSVLLVCVVLMLISACSNPKNLRVTEKNKETFLKDIKDSKGLTVEEGQLLASYMMRYGIAEGLKGFNNGKNELPLEGKTVGELIELQRQWTKDQETAEAAQKKLAIETKAKEEAIAAEIRKYIGLTVYDKGFMPQDYEEHRFDAYLTLSVIYENTSQKDIRAFQGDIVFQDLFGDNVYNVSIKIMNPVKAGKKAKWKGQSKFNQFDDKQVRFNNAEMKDLKVVWIPKQIIFTDGTTIPGQVGQGE